MPSSRAAAERLPVETTLVKTDISRIDALMIIANIAKEFYIEIALCIGAQSRTLMQRSTRIQERALRGLLPPPPRKGFVPSVSALKSGAERDRV
jgi:hypothetical protein